MQDVIRELPLPDYAKIYGAEVMCELWSWPLPLSSAAAPYIILQPVASALTLAWPWSPCHPQFR